MQAFLASKQTSEILNLSRWSVMTDKILVSLSRHSRSSGIGCLSDRDMCESNVLGVAQKMHYSASGKWAFIGNHGPQKAKDAPSDQICAPGSRAPSSFSAKELSSSPLGLGWQRSRQQEEAAIAAADATGEACSSAEQQLGRNRDDGEFASPDSNPLAAGDTQALLQSLRLEINAMRIEVARLTKNSEHMPVEVQAAKDETVSPEDIIKARRLCAEYRHSQNHDKVDWVRGRHSPG